MSLLEPPTGVGIFLVMRAERRHDDPITVNDFARGLDYFSLCFDAASLAAQGVDPDPEQTPDLDGYLSQGSPVIWDIRKGSIEIALDLTPWAAGLGGIAAVAQVLYLFEKYRNVRLRLALEAAELEELLAKKSEVAKQEEVPQEGGPLARHFERLLSEREAAVSTDLSPIDVVVTTDPEEASL